MRETTCYIVDDELRVANRMKSLLQNFTELVVAGIETNPRKAITKIFSVKPDIVFLDIEMPGKSGFEVIEELRAKNCNPTFIMVTAYDHYSIKAIKESAFDYLLKPVDIDELKEAIDRYKSTNGLQPVINNRDWLSEMNISSREEEIIQLLVQGKTSDEIGKELFISKHTVDTHRRNILHKLNLKTTNALISLAIEKGGKGYANYLNI